MSGLLQHGGLMSQGAYQDIGDGLLSGKYAKKGLKERAKETITYGLLSDAVSALGVFGDAYQGKVDPASDEALERVMGMADLFGPAALASMARRVPKDALQSMIAYHGSPHDFDKFDMSKIGTGEGAQAFGHGLYFAEAEGTAQAYRDALKLKGYDSTADAKVLADAGLTPSDIRASEQFLAIGADPDAAARDIAAWVGKPVTPELKAAVEQIVQKRPKGRMYEVNIKAEPDEFLDWDKRLDQQHPNILRKLGVDPDTMQESFAALDKAKQTIREKYDPQGSLIDAMRMNDDELLGALSGPASNDPIYRQREEAENALRGIVREWVSRPDAPAREIVKAGDPVENARRLRAAGIKGIRYLDQGSRSKGEGSRNFVVFDDELVDINRKYAAGAPIPPSEDE